MPDILIGVILLLGGAVAGLVACGGRVLRSWYLHEVQRSEIAEDPADAIVTYPLA